MVWPRCVLLPLLLLLPATSRCEDAALVVRKCCKRGQALRATDYKCIDREEVRQVEDWLDPKAQIETLDGRKLEKLFPSTPPDGAIEYGNGDMCLKPIELEASFPGTVLLENGVLRVGNLFFSPKIYCSDRAIRNDTTDFYVYILCSFKKCCSSNKTLDWNAKNHNLSCIHPPDEKKDQKWTPKVYDQRSRLLNSSEFPLKLFTGGVMKCDITHYRYLVDSKNSFNLQLDGSVHVGDPFNLDFHYGNFCVDRTYVRGELHTAVVVCVSPPAKMTFWNVICVTVTLTICLCVLLFPFIVPKLNTTTMKLVMCHMICEVFTYIFRTIAFATGVLPMPACKSYALMMQYLRLAGFFWINVMCIDMASKFSGKMRAPSRELRRSPCTRRFAWYSLHAWGWPAVIVAVTAALDLAPGLGEHPLRPYIGDITCNFHSLKTALLYYYGAVILLVLVNIGLFIVTSISIYRTKQEVLDILTRDHYPHDIQIANREDQRSLMLYLKIFCLMGLTYVTEIIAWCDGSTFSSILMDVNSMLLSFFVFLLFCCKPQVVRDRLEELKQRWRALRAA